MTDPLEAIVASTPGLIPDDQMGWAEDEIAKAQDRHREQGRGALWNSFRLLSPTHPRLRYERLYRAHCHELLERMAGGQDTTQATDAEMLAVLGDIGDATPLSSAGECLYLRILQRRFPDVWAAVEEVMDLTAYERIHGNRADDREEELRNKLRRQDRTA
jgi:hypothetical protein